MDIDRLRRVMGAANPAGSGQYFDPGTYIAKLTKHFYKLAQDGTGKEFVIFEFEVLQSSNPDIKVGSTRSETADPSKKGWEARLYALIDALLGIDPKSPLATSPEVRTQVVQISCALFSNEERQRMGLPENFLALRQPIVKVEAYPKDTQAGKHITATKYAPYVAPAAPAGA